MEETRFEMHMSLSERLADLLREHGFAVEEGEAEEFDFAERYFLCTRDGGNAVFSVQPKSRVPTDRVVVFGPRQHSCKNAATTEAVLETLKTHGAREATPPRPSCLRLPR
jgi:hypothetical protein